MADATANTRALDTAAALTDTITEAALGAMPEADEAAASIVEAYAADVARSITRRLPAAVAQALSNDG